MPGSLRRQNSQMSDAHSDADGSRVRSGMLTLPSSFKRQISGTLHSIDAVRRLKLRARAAPRPRAESLSHDL